LGRKNKSEPLLVSLKTQPGFTRSIYFSRKYMTRPRIHRCLQFNPDVDYFKPRGVPLRELEEVELLPDEIEAIKLYFVGGLDQTQAAEKMGISQPTFARTIDSANKKTAEALIKGKAIKINRVLVEHL